MQNESLFSAFPPISKAQWLQKVAKDLKNTPLEALEWEICDGIKQSPFVHREDFLSAPPTLSDHNPGWELCEKIEVNDPVEANIQALEALNGGAEALDLVFHTSPDRQVFDTVLKDIQLDFIGLHFSGAGITQNPANIFALLLQYAAAKGIDSKALSGSLDYDPIKAGGIMDWRYLVELISFAQDNFPNFKLLNIDFESEANPAKALGNTLKRANEYLQKLNERGIAPGQAQAYMQFSVPVGPQYFLEIAKLRALKLLWINILKAWQIVPSYPQISASFQAASYSDALYTNMIRASTMAMSAVLGGASRLTVLPYDNDREASAQYPAGFGRRIARNVQHLLKMESGFDQLEDPAAGSYYVERLTLTIAEKAWSVFSETAK